MDAVSAVVSGFPAGAIEYRVLPAVLSVHRDPRYFDKVVGAAASHPAGAGKIVVTQICDQTLIHLVAALGDSIGVKENSPVLCLGFQVGRGPGAGTDVHISAHVTPHFEQLAEVII